MKDVQVKSDRSVVGELGELFSFEDLFVDREELEGSVLDNLSYFLVMSRDFIDDKTVSS